MNFKQILKAGEYKLSSAEDENGFIPHKNLRGSHWHKDQVTGKHIYDIPKNTPQQPTLSNKPKSNKPSTNKVKPQKFSNSLPQVSNSLPPFSNAHPPFYNSVPASAKGVQLNNNKAKVKQSSHHESEASINSSHTYASTIPFGKMIIGVDTNKEPSKETPTKVDLEGLDSDKKINEAMYTARQEYFTAKNSKQDLTPHLNNLEELINHSKATIGEAQTIHLWDDSESKVKKDTNSLVPHDSFNRVTHDDMINTTPDAIEHISKHLSEETEPQWASLTKDQESALTWYTRHGDEVMNPIVSDPAKFNSLSDPKARVNPKTLGVSREHLEDICDPDDLKAIRSEVLKSIKSLDEATTNMHLPSDHLLYRAVDLSYFKDQIPPDTVDNIVKHNANKDSKNLIKELNKLEGLNFTDPSYGSTSIDKAVAHNFLNTHSRVVLEIAAPKGTKGSWIGDNSNFEDEKEFLLPRSTKYAIVGVRHGVDHVHLQVSIIS